MTPEVKLQATSIRPDPLSEDNAEGKVSWVLWQVICFKIQHDMECIQRTFIGALDLFHNGEAGYVRLDTHHWWHQIVICGRFSAQKQPGLQCEQVRPTWRRCMRSAYDDLPRLDLRISLKPAGPKRQHSIEVAPARLISFFNPRRVVIIDASHRPLG